MSLKATKYSVIGNDNGPVM